MSIEISPSQEVVVNPEVFKRKALQGVVALGIRRIIVQIIQTVANVILARILFPEDFGLFALVSFYVTIFSLISDIGLNAALIQSRNEPTDNQLKSIFTTHILLGTFVAILMVAGVPLFEFFYHKQLGQEGRVLLLLVSIAPLLLNLKLVPYSLLERKLRYRKLVIGEIVELVVLEIITVILALRGFGAASFVWGMLVSRGVASVLFFILEPWHVGFHFSFTPLRSFFSFGIPYQVSNGVGVISGALAPVAVGGFIGTTALGLINWAGGVGAFPRFIGEIAGRIMFPIGARLAQDRRLLKIAIERAIEVTSILTLPLVAVMLALVPPITYIVFTGRWEAGIPALYLFTLQAGFMVFSVILTNALLAVGNARAVRNINLFWVALQWILTVPLVTVFGFTGFAVAALLVSLTFFIPLWQLQKYVHISFVTLVLPYMLYAALSGIATYLYSWIFPIKSLWELLFAVFLGLAFYSIFLFLFRRKSVLQFIELLRFGAGYSS